MAKVEEKTKLEVYDDATGEMVVIDDPELEAELVASLEEADRGELIDGDEVLRQLRAMHRKS
jgi:predicted transcriptional regulator